MYGLNIFIYRYLSVFSTSHNQYHMGLNVPTGVRFVFTQKEFSQSLLDSDVLCIRCQLSSLSGLTTKLHTAQYTHRNNWHFTNTVNNIQVKSETGIIPPHQLFRQLPSDLNHRKLAVNRLSSHDLLDSSSWHASRGLL